MASSTPRIIWMTMPAQLWAPSPFSSLRQRTSRCWSALSCHEAPQPAGLLLGLNALLRRHLVLVMAPRYDTIQRVRAPGGCLIKCCGPHAVEHASVQVQLSGTDVVTGIDSPDQYQTNAYFKVRDLLSSLALWTSAAAQPVQGEARPVRAQHVKGSPADGAHVRTLPCSK